LAHREKEKVGRMMDFLVFLGWDNYRVVGLVPISNEDSVITSWIREWDGNSWSAENPNASKTASGFVECKGWEIVKTPNLIFDLKDVSKILPWWDGARCSKNTIFE